MTVGFAAAFKALTGHGPFLWQERLFQDFCAGRLLSSLDLPTGLGKTSVMAVWLIARALADDGARKRIPRRLVYVVDRRAVVDQATEEAVKIRKGLDKSGLNLAQLGLAGRQGDLPISTLRGQYADNRDWLGDPTSAAIIVGTIDMIGSRLLFSGYGVSRGMRPMQAAFLGMDTLIVLDEAHLVPPFEALLKTIALEERKLWPRDPQQGGMPVSRMQLMSLSATGREGEDAGSVFRLVPEDEKDELVARRLKAVKRLKIEDAESGDLVEKMVERAWERGEGGRKVIVYCNSRVIAQKVCDGLEAKLNKLLRDAPDKGSAHLDRHLELIVGARRVHERERLAKSFVFRRFARSLGEEEKQKQAAALAMPAFLVATSAGEVGVDIDANHMVCDLVPWERMVQRLGRVNRRGDFAEGSLVDVFAVSPDKEAESSASAEKLKRWQEPFEYPNWPSEGGRLNASPGSLLKLREDGKFTGFCLNAMTESPLHPKLTRELLDAWSMTSLDDHTGRPDVQPWLRGWEKDDEQAVIVWRRHLPVRVQSGRSVQVSKKEIDEFFEAAPPHLSEMLETETWWAVDWLVARGRAVMKQSAKETGLGSALNKDSPVLFVLNSKGELDRDGKRRGVWTLSELAELDNKEKRNDKDDFLKILNDRTLVVSSLLGGLEDGMLANEADGEPSTIDADESWEGRPFHAYETNDPAPTKDADWKQSYRLAIEKNEDDEEIRWIVVEERRGQAETEDSRAISRNEALEVHRAATERIARQFAKGIGLPPTYIEMLGIAARLHDEGKKALRWQRAFNAPRDGKIYAKTKGPINQKLLDGYRHEFGSLPYLVKDAAFKNLPDDLQDLATHLVGAHHGGARPLISTLSCDDAPPSALEGRARDVALRFARLQRRWGPWGLAWWESLLRAADQKASRENEPEENGEGNADDGEDR